MQPRIHGQFATAKEIALRQKCKEALAAELDERDRKRGLKLPANMEIVKSYPRKRASRRKRPATTDLPLLMEASHAA